MNESKTVASNQLKIGQRIAYKYAVIARRGFCERQNSYGNTGRVKFEFLCPTNEDSIQKYPSKTMNIILINPKIEKQKACKLTSIVI